MLDRLNKYKGRLAFVGVFLVLSVASTSISSNGATSSSTTTTTVNRCDVYTCTPALPKDPSGAAENKLDSQWGQPVFEDDFSGPLNTATWEVYNYPNGNPKRVADNVSVSDGLVDLAGTYKAGRNAGSGISENFDQKYGRWEVRARADIGAGYSPTILLWPQNENWPKAGEIDLLESPHGNRRDALAAVHNTTAGNFQTHTLSGSQSDWHIYAVDWFADHITFYVDGVEQWKVTDPKLVPTISPMHLVLQNDAGCGWIQCPNASTKPITDMQVDWVKVYAPPQS